MEVNDIYQAHLVAPASVGRDGNRFFLTVINSPGSLVHHSWCLGFETRIEAEAAARALIIAGTYQLVFVNEELAAYKRGRW